MTESICPLLRRLGLLLRSAYRLRNNRLASSKDGTGLANAELDLLRVHNLIARHRSLCRHCKFNEALATILYRKQTIPNSPALLHLIE
jgi:hypothetical protein